MVDARIPDHCGWAARGRWRDAYDAAVSDLAAAHAEIERLTKEWDAAETAKKIAIAFFLDHEIMRKKAESERDEARAQVAAAYGSAADALQNVADNWDCGHNESRLCDCARDVEQWGFAADEVRGMTPADAEAALEAYGREKVREGMQRAAEWIRPQRNTTPATGEEFANAILAAMEKDADQ